jgi:hypothetical protein
MRRRKSVLGGLIKDARQVYGEEHPETLSAMQTSGVAYTLEAKYDRAEPILSKAVEVSRRALGEENPNTLLSMSALATVYANRGSMGSDARVDPVVDMAEHTEQRTRKRQG